MKTIESIFRFAVLPISLIIIVIRYFLLKRYLGEVEFELMADTRQEDFSKELMPDKIKTILTHTGAWVWIIVLLIITN